MNSLDDWHRDPVRRQTSRQQTFEPIEFATYFGDIFRIDIGLHTPVLKMFEQVSGQEPGLKMFVLVFVWLCGTGLEWNVPLWFASLDLTQALDRVEHDPLFRALLERDVPKPYCALLGILHLNKNWLSSARGNIFHTQRREARRCHQPDFVQRCLTINNTQTEMETAVSWHRYQCRRTAHKYSLCR